MTPSFGFAQFDFAGTLPLADGRYLVSTGSEGDNVLVIATVGAPAQPGRRRRRPREAGAGAEPAALPVARATAIRAFAPFDQPAAAARWLEQACEAEETADELLADGIALLNAAVHARAVAAADPHLGALTPERTVAARIGYGSGEEVAESGWTEAREVRRLGDRRLASAPAPGGPAPAGTTGGDAQGTGAGGGLRDAAAARPRRSRGRPAPRGGAAAAGRARRPCWSSCPARSRILGTSAT